MTKIRGLWAGLWLSAFSLFAVSLFAVAQQTSPGAPAGQGGAAPGQPRQETAAGAESAEAPAGRTPAATGAQQAPGAAAPQSASKSPAKPGAAGSAKPAPANAGSASKNKDGTGNGTSDEPDEFVPTEQIDPDQEVVFPADI